MEKVNYRERRGKLLEILSKANIDEQFALDIERTFQCTAQMAKEYKYNPIYFRNLLRKYKSTLFQHRIKIVTCTLCSSPKNIHYRSLSVLNRKLSHKPFCSRKCYFQYLKQYWDKRKYALHRFYIKAPMSKWPNLLFGRRQAWYKTHLVVWRYYCLETSVPINTIDYSLIEQMAIKMGVSYKYMEQCVQRGRRAEKRRGKPYEFTPLDMKDLGKFNYTWRYPVQDAEYRTIWSWVDGILLHKK